jgi:hypothetical protein
MTAIPTQTLPLDAPLSLLGVPGNELATDSARVRAIAARVANRPITELGRGVRQLASIWAKPLVRALKHSKRDAVPIAALTVISLVGTLGAGVFAHNPQLLVALSPRLPFLALTAPHLGYWRFLGIAGVRCCLADPFHFRIGRRVGTELHTDRPKRTGYRKLLRSGILTAIFLAPVGRHLMAAGATGVRRRWVICADIAGTITYLTTVYFLGNTLL